MATELLRDVKFRMELLPAQPVWMAQAPRSKRINPTNSWGFNDKKAEKYLEKLRNTTLIY